MYIETNKYAKTTSLVLALRRWIYSDSVTHVSKGASLFYLLLADIMSENANFYLRYIKNLGVFV